MTTTMKATSRVNGVDMTQVKETVAALKRDPSLARFQFRASNRWITGTRNSTRIADFHGVGRDIEHPRPFQTEADEPPVVFGNDSAPNPVEHLLTALASCVTTGIACHAASRGIRIESIESTLEGDIDVRGFLGLSDEVERGFQQIRMAIRVKSDAPPEVLAELANYSPVLNTITRSTPVEVTVEEA
ncbi:MAG: hypothetical protein BIFFINMI_00073 [Phycisphaerae bacterium]|nr:hypothetical protein [Phycisphaerae bacterium]